MRGHYRPHGRPPHAAEGTHHLPHREDTNTSPTPPASSTRQRARRDAPEPPTHPPIHMGRGSSHGGGGERRGTGGGDGHNTKRSHKEKTYAQVMMAPLVLAAAIAWRRGGRRGTTGRDGSRHVDGRPPRKRDAHQQCDSPAYWVPRRAGGGGRGGKERAPAGSGGGWGGRAGSGNGGGGGGQRCGGKRVGARRMRGGGIAVPAAAGRGAGDGERRGSSTLGLDRWREQRGREQRRRRGAGTRPGWPRHGHAVFPLETVHESGKSQRGGQGVELERLRGMSCGGVLAY